MEKRKKNVGFINRLIVPSVGRSGGLALLWRKDITVDIQSYLDRHIDAIVTEGFGFIWRITGFYGNPEAHQQKESWDLLKALSRKFNLPWLCLGDFNEITSMKEKLGRARRSQRQIEEFREAINCCSFKDLGFCGLEYTWCNMQEGVHRRCLWLDKALATQDWINHYKDVRVHHLVESTSDHVAPLIFDSFAMKKPQRRFQFEAMWTKREECKDIIMEAWTGRPS